MSIRVPLTNPVRGGSIGAGISTNAGTQPLAAMQQIGNSISSHAQKMFNTQVKLARVENERLVSNEKASLRKLIAQHNIDMMQNPDPSSWGSELKTKVGEHMSGIDRSKMSPEARESFDGWAANYVANEELRVSKDATIQGVRLAHMDSQNRRMEYKKNNDYDSIDEDIENDTLMSLPEKDRAKINNQAEREDYAKKIQIENIQNLAMSDPVAFEMYSQDDDYWEGVNPSDKSRLINFGRSHRRLKENEATENALNKFNESSIKTKEALRQLLEKEPLIGKARTNKILSSFKDDKLLPTNATKADLKLRIYDLKRKLENGSIKEGSKEHFDSYGAIRGHISSVVGTDGDMGALKNELNGTSPFQEHKIPRNKLNDNYFKNRAERILYSAMKDGVTFGSYHNTLADADINPKERAKQERENERAKLNVFDTLHELDVMIKKNKNFGQEDLDKFILKALKGNSGVGRYGLGYSEDDGFGDGILPTKKTISEPNNYGLTPPTGL